MRSVIRIAAYTALLVGLIGFVSVRVTHGQRPHAVPPLCGSGTNTSSCSVDATGTFPNYNFSPQSVTLQLPSGGGGISITWVNIEPAGTVPHTSTGDGTNAADTWDSGTLNPGGPGAAGSTFTHTFTASGTYGYHCFFHGSPGSGMFGTITVQAPTASRLIAFHAKRTATSTRFSWRLASTSGVVGFRLYAGGHSLFARAIPARPGQPRFAVIYRGHAVRSVYLAVILRNGSVSRFGPFRAE